jgi:hypothetical protein
VKLRIKGNSLRLRVTRSDLVSFLTSGSIDETIHFTPDKDALLTYVLRHEPSAVAATVEYKPTEVVVILPTADARTWADSNRVGIYAKLNLGVHGELELVVEKDFACLDLSDAENADTFPNPNADVHC